MAPIEVKRISSSSQTPTVSPFPCTKNTLSTVCVYVRSAHSNLRVCMMRKRAAYACRTNLCITATISWRVFAFDRTRKRAAYVGLRHAHIKASAGLRHAYATLSLLSRRVVNVSSRSCHCVLWAALRSQGQVARWQKILEKNSKADVKNTFGKGKNSP